MKGRKPKSAARQLAEGDPRKRGVHKLQALLNAEPPATKGLPPCPRHLRGRARAAWGVLADELAKMNLDHKVDAYMLEGVCVSYDRAVQADIQLHREGLTVEESVIDDKSGEKIVLRVKTHPAEGISRRAWNLVRSFCTEFGFSPVSLTRLSVDQQEKLPDLAELLSKPRTPRRDPLSVQ